jgi:hypothetical protein
VVDKTGIEKDHTAGVTAARRSCGRTVFYCAKVNRICEADVKSTKKLQRPIRNTQRLNARAKDSADYPAANLEIGTQANSSRDKTNAQGGVRWIPPCEAGP